MTAKSASSGLLCYGAPIPQATLGPVVLRFIADPTLHLPLTVGYFLDDNGKPGAQYWNYQFIEHDREGVKFWGLLPNQVIWIEVLNLRQSPERITARAMPNRFLPARKT